MKEYEKGSGVIKNVEIERKEADDMGTVKKTSSKSGKGKTGGGSRTKPRSVAEDSIQSLWDVSQQMEPNPSVDERPSNFGESSVQKELNSAHREKHCFYMPVDQLRAQVYLAHGLIYPSAYDAAVTASGFNDLQQKNPYNLLLFPNPRPIKENQLLLKVLLTDEETNDCVKVREAFKFPMPLPISRLIGIGVPATVESISFYIDGWIKPDVPVPRHLFRIVEFTSAIDDCDSLDYTSSDDGPIPEMMESIHRYDRYMGLLAFMRNVERYFSSKTLSYGDYPETFFSLNKKLLQEQDVAKANDENKVLSALIDLKVNLSPTQQEIVSLVKSSDAFIEKEKARKIAGAIYFESGSNDSLAQAFQELFAGDYRSAIQKMQSSSVPPEAILLAVLYKYCSRTSNDHINVKQRLHEDWKDPNQVVEALGILGAYYGYTALPAKETRLYGLHPIFKSVVPENPAIKFELSTTYERLVIESLYQRGFYCVAPGENVRNLYKLVNPLPSPSSKPIIKFLNDKSYKVDDLLVRRYEPSATGRIILRMLEITSEFLDERSETGRYLLHECFFHADEYEISRKGSRNVLRYRIQKQKVVDLISDEIIVVNERVLEAALDEDRKRRVL